MIEALGIAIVKNEADVIEAFVRHNLGFMDALFIADNASVDGTREILLHLQQEGLPLVLFDDPVVAHVQSEKMTAMYRRIVPLFKPKFVFSLDADEFVVAQSREALFAQLRAIKPGSQAHYYWRTYIPAPVARASDDFDPLRDITYRRTSEKPRAKVIVITNARFDNKLKIEQGNHNITVGRRRLRTVNLNDVVLAHFPVRTIDQAVGKGLVGWITNMERRRRQGPSDMGFQKKLLYERIVYGSGLTPQDLTAEAFRYSQAASITFEALKDSQAAGAEEKWPDGVVYDPIKPGYSQLTARAAASCTSLQKVMRCVDKILNPEAMDSVTSTEFLSIDSKYTGWRRFLSPTKAAPNPSSFFRSGRRGHRECLDIPPFRYLAERDNPVSVLEIGCGSGGYLRYFESRGARTVKGVGDADATFKYLQRGQAERVNLSNPLDLSEVFDLVVCLHAIDRADFSQQSVVIDNIVRHASKRIVFCGTRPGRVESSQMHSRPILGWLELFSSAGWYPHLFDSLALRSLATVPRLAANLLVLTKDDSGFAVAKSALVELEQSDVDRGANPPNVITHPFTQTAREWEKRKFHRSTTGKFR